MRLTKLRFSKNFGCNPLVFVSLAVSNSLKNIIILTFWVAAIKQFGIWAKYDFKLFQVFINQKEVLFAKFLNIIC